MAALACAAMPAALHGMCAAHEAAAPCCFKAGTLCVLLASRVCSWYPVSSFGTVCVPFEGHHASSGWLLFSAVGVRDHVRLMLGMLALTLAFLSIAECSYTDLFSRPELFW
jgi:hypothetical protein